MTIDITIGKIEYRTIEEVMKTYYYPVIGSSILSLSEFLNVIKCPDEPDGCSEEDTICPNTAYRSGSIWGMEEFFKAVMPCLIKEIRPSNSVDVAFIKPYLNRINKLEYTGKDKQHKMRLHWLKFWCNRAVELYDDKAVIQFS